MCACEDGTLREVDVEILGGPSDQQAEGAADLELRPKIEVVTFPIEQLFSLHQNLRRKATVVEEEPTPSDAELESAQASSPTVRA